MHYRPNLRKFADGEACAKEVSRTAGTGEYLITSCWKGSASIEASTTTSS